MKTLEERAQEGYEEAAKTMAELKAVPVIFMGWRPDGNKVTLDYKAIEAMGCDFENFDDRARLGQTIRRVFAFVGITQSLHYSESWAIHTEGTREDVKKEREKYPDLAHHPKRYECVHFMAEEIGRSSLGGHVSIIRPAGKDPYFDNDFEVHETKLEGRFANLLGYQLTKQERSAFQMMTLEFILRRR